MAKVINAWGIDIGQCALKALRCHNDPQKPGRVIADAFDYIEYPRILSQPEADPAALVSEALGLFLSRNQVQGDRVAISVSGSSGLARFIKLPPVETKKIPDIVRYEANQQIPFDLNDVIWDYQRMYGGSEEEGFALETEVGLFAMKRDQVYQALAPLAEADIDVDIVQLTPLALYNFLVFDRLGQLPPEDEFDPEHPPESIMALSLGTETTDLVITNGFRVWQRNIPIGGSHFTKALTKELKLTYAKAEHLKRNAAHAEDPKAVYQAMRPVFKDLLTEIQRSEGFFKSLDKTARIGRVVTLGNSMKLPGLKRYLSQNLGYDVAEVSSFSTLAGASVVAAPAYKNNVLCFGVAYGLALQGLGQARLGTNLVPVEMIRDRIIRRKKPWALAASLLLTIGALASFLLLWLPWSRVLINEKQDWKESVQLVTTADGESKRFLDSYNGAKSGYSGVKQNGDEIVNMLDKRLPWHELLLAVNQALPHDPPDKRPEELDAREEIHLLDFRVQKVDDLGRWATPHVRNLYARNRVAPPMPPPTALPGGEPAKGNAPSAEVPGGMLGPASAMAQRQVRYPAAPPAGPGYVVQLRGYHLHNAMPIDNAGDFVRRTLIENLEGMTVRLPSSDGRSTVDVPIRELSIAYPVILAEDGPKPVEVANPQALYDPDHPDRKPDPTAPKLLTLFKYEFVVQFAWQPRPGVRGPGRVAASMTIPGAAAERK